METGAKQMQTPIQYAKAEYRAERFPTIGFYVVCGKFYLTDKEGNLLVRLGKIIMD